MRFSTSILFQITALVAVVATILAWIINLNPFPVTEFQDLPGVRASSRLDWRYSVSPKLVTSVSHKSQESIDSYSAWTSFVVTPDVAETLAAEIHNDFASMNGYMRNNYQIEQRIQTIHSVSFLSPTGTTPDWWKPEKEPGLATEIMLFSDGLKWGTAQGCYTIYNRRINRLWVYRYACQGDPLWKKGTEAPLTTQSNSE